MATTVVRPKAQVKYYTSSKPVRVLAQAFVVFGD